MGHCYWEHTPPASVDTTFDFGEWTMLGLAVTLLIIALIAAVLGFGGIAGTAVGMAKIVFFVFLVLFLISLLFGGLRGGGSRAGFRGRTRAG